MRIMKPGRVVILLSGRQAGKKAIIVKSYEDRAGDIRYSHALVIGIERYPLPVTKKMSKKKRTQRNKIKPFIKIANENHLLATRYTVDTSFDSTVVNKDAVKNMKARKLAKASIRSVMQKKYVEGKHRWFFHKLRF